MSVRVKPKLQKSDKVAQRKPKAGERRKEDVSTDSSSSDDDQDSTPWYVEPLPSTGAEKQAYIDAVTLPGQRYCFLRTYNAQPVFGILAVDVHEARLFGTCIMSDGQYETFSCHVLGVAAERCRQQPFSALCPRVELLALLLERNKDQRAMRFDIKMVESDFIIAMRRAAQKQKIADAIAKKPTDDAVVDAEKSATVLNAAAQKQQEGDAPVTANLPDVTAKKQTDDAVVVDAEKSATVGDAEAQKHQEGGAAAATNLPDETTKKETDDAVVVDPEKSAATVVNADAQKQQQGDVGAAAQLPDETTIKLPDEPVANADKGKVVDADATPQQQEDGVGAAPQLPDETTKRTTDEAVAYAERGMVVGADAQKQLPDATAINQTDDAEKGKVVDADATPQHQQGGATAAAQLPDETTKRPTDDAVADAEKGMVVGAVVDAEEGKVVDADVKKQQKGDAVADADLKEPVQESATQQTKHDVSRLLILQQYATQSRTPLFREADFNDADFDQAECEPGPSISSTDAKVDVLTNCVMAITQQLAFLTQANKQSVPFNFQIKKEYMEPEIVDVTLNTSDEGEPNDARSFTTWTGKTEAVQKASKSVANESEDVGKPKRSMDNGSSGNESGLSTMGHPPRRRKNSLGKRVRTPAYTQSKQRRDLTARNWKMGVRRNCTSTRIEKEIAEATVPSLAMVPETLRVLGFAIIRNFKKVSSDDVNALYDSGSDENASASGPRLKSCFSEGNDPSPEQAAFYDTPGWSTSGKGHKPKSEPIFEGVTISSKNYNFGPGKLKQSNHTEPCPRTGRLPRQTLKANSKALQVYNEKYKGQMEDIIRGMFGSKQRRGRQHPAADPNHWHLSQTIVWGGTEHQHPHCDLAKAGAFNYDDIFPFVCVHGFGINEFIMWLLPAQKKRDYGFPYKFPKNALLFFRGDFIHAGWFYQACRAHMEFFPKAAAGWTRTRYPYWATKESLHAWQLAKTSFFVPDLRTYPFAYPEFSEEDEQGQQTVSYPSCHTEGLFPHLDQQRRNRASTPNLDDSLPPPPPAPGGNKRKAEKQTGPQLPSMREQRKKRQR